VRVKQRVYFALRSKTIAAAEITAKLGIEPDDFKVMGSRLTNPPRPMTHKWSVGCDDAGLRVDEQLEITIARLLPQQAEITRLAQKFFLEGDACGAFMSVVRDFAEEDGEEESETVVELDNGMKLEKLSGQHQLLSWHMTHDTMRFLLSVGSKFDVDEYG